LIAPDDPRVLRVGMPKTDPLLAAEPEREELVRALELDPDKPTVLYAPTRSGSAGSSIDSWGIEAIDRLAALPVNVVVKLHDRSLKRFRRKLAVDFEELLATREAQGKLRLFRHHDVIPALRAADVLITDLSSVANEFLLRDRPVIYLAVPGHEEHIRRTAGKKFGADDPEHLDWLRGAGDLVEEPAALPAAVERALADPSRLSAERRERSRILFYNPGTATSHAVEGLYRILDLAPA
jgi:CDP-glycerol glycerophosphotransferase (TagB/SpsB family)